VPHFDRNVAIKEETSFSCWRLKTWSCPKKKSKLLFLFESLVSKPGLPLAAFGDGHIHSAEWDQNLSAAFLKCHYIFSRILKNYDKVYGDPVSKHSITYTEDGIKETEMRGFSSHCEVLSNSEGKCCSMCSKTKDNLRWKHFRQEEYKDRPLIPQRWNHK